MAERSYGRRFPAQADKISVDGRGAETIVRHSLFAGVAQLVEHHLAKVDVGRSNRLARSIFRVYTKDWGGGVDGGLRLPGKGQPHCAMTRSR